MPLPTGLRAALTDGEGMIQAPTRIKTENVEELVSKMISAARPPARTLSLNLAHVKSIERPAGALLSNVLLTDLSSVPLEVIPPRRLPVEKILSSSLGFAFAHRAGALTVKDVREQDLRLEQWRLPYTPARHSLPFDDALDVPEPSYVLTAQAAFVNPHEAARRPHRNDVPSRIQSWLHHLLPPRALEPPQFLQDLHNLTYELVDNVAEHADAGHTGVKSIVQVSLARGNAADVRDRIWVLVMDTGPGILATAIPKLLPTARPVSQEERLSFLSKLFSEDAPTVGRARGLGLPRVAAICRRWQGARLEVVTDDCRLSIEGDNVSPRMSTLHVQGTMVTARFTTPPVPTAGR